MLWNHEAQPNESTTNFKPHSTCFSPQYQLIKKMFSEHELKKALHDSDVSSVVWTLIDNSKLANQIARLGSNCGKKKPRTYNMLLKDNIQCLHQDKVSKVIQKS